MFKRKSYFLMIFLLIFSLILTACSGSSSDSTTQRKISGQIYIPEASLAFIDSAEDNSSTRTESVNQTEGEIPFPRANLIVKNFATGENIATATANENGKYTIIGLNSRLDLIVIAADGNNQVRASAIIPAADSEDENNNLSANINTATSVVTETLVKIRDEIGNIDTTKLANSISEVETALQERFTSLADKNLLAVNGEVLYEDFGTGIKEIVPNAEEFIRNMYQEGRKSGEKLILREAAPEKGFNYPYYLYLPENIPQNSSVHLLVEPNNSGRSNDELQFFLDNAKRRAEGHWLAEKLNIPVIVPTFPRPKTQPEGVDPHSNAYTHSLCRQSLFNIAADENLYRVDLQLNEMIKDAQSFLAGEEISLKDKVFINGFSASGDFVNRFTALHPEKVAAAAAGGVNGLLTIPASEVVIDNTTYQLTYPVGISDLNLVNIDFDLNSFQNTPQFYYMGDKDTNDTLPYDDAFDEEEKQLIFDIYNTEVVWDDTQTKEDAAVIVERFNKTEKFYKNKNVAGAEFKVYQDVGHEFNAAKITEDIVQFFEKIQ